MSIRDYCNVLGFQIVGKLTRKYCDKSYWCKQGGHLVEVVKREMYYIDEAGNEYYKDNAGYTIITAEGGIL